MTAVYSFLIFAILGIVNFSWLAFPLQASGEMLSLKTVSLRGQTYLVQYSLDHGTIQSITADNHNLFLKLNSTESGNGNLTLVLPMDLASKLFGPGATTGPIQDFIGAFVDAIDLTSKLQVNSTCDSVVLKVGIVPGASDVVFSGSYMAGGGGENSSSDVRVRVTPILVADGKQFKIDTFTDSTACVFSLDKSKKDLHIAIQSPNDSQGYMKLAIPHELLGGNYTVLIDGKPSTVYNITAADANITSIETRYDPSAKSIDIIGTSVIPEFPVLPPVLIAGITVLGIVIVITKKERRLD